MAIDLIAANTLIAAPESLLHAGLEDWIVVAVILAGALQGVGQAIVKKIKQRQEAGTQTPDGGPTSPNDPLAQRTTPPHQRPDRPVARPARMGSGPTPGRRTPTPIQAPRPIAQPIAQPTAKPPLARPVPPQTATRHRNPAGPHPASAQPTRRSAPKSASKTPAPKHKTTRLSKSGQSTLQKRAPKKRADKKKQTVAEHHLQLSENVSHPATETDHLDTIARERLIPPLTRRSLRQAVILREVLGPPVALRDPDQTGW